MCGGTERQADYDNNDLVPVLPDAIAMVKTIAILKPTAEKNYIVSANYLVGRFPTTFEGKSR
jgi:hypothetical protein